MFRKFYIVLCLAACWWMMACTSSVQREAQETVAQADSLWRAGEAYTDSVALAKAYETLSSSRYQLLSIFNKPLATDYAHACYHYGKLLRAKENPVAAMECFINATHSRTRDYHILGRVYSNMGDMCHIYGNYSLSHDMYELSGAMYLRNGDTLLYFYDMNNMAFEKAALKQNSTTCQLLDIIRSYHDIPLYAKSLETEAFMHQTKRNYDSVVSIMDTLQQRYGYTENFGYMMKARAFSYQGMTDSALCYAQKVIIGSNENTSIAAYYILIHDDCTLTTDSLISLFSARTDIHNAWAKIQSKLSQAVQLLEQDIHRKNDWRGWVVAILIIICFAVSIIYFVARKKRKLAQEKVLLLTNQHADTMIESIKKHIDTSDLNQTLHWKEYALMKSDADLYMNGIVSKLESHKLNEVDIRFCILTLLDYPQKQIAETIHYGYPSGIKTLKKRVSEKLKTTPSELKSFLLQKM